MNHPTMNTETQVPTAEETQNAVSEATEKPELVEQEATDEADEKVESQEPEAKDLLEAEVKRLRREAKKAQRNNARLYAELEVIKSRGTGEQPEAKVQDVDSLVEERVSILAFADKANSIVETGTKKHSDFVDTLKDLAKEVGEFVQRNGKPSQFMEVVLEVADDSAALLYHLGKNPEIASELADLSPLKLAKRLDRIERELGEASKPKTSNAPKPLEPVKAKSTDSGLSSDLPVDEWMRRREKELREKRGY